MQDDTLPSLPPDDSQAVIDPTVPASGAEMPVAQPVAATAPTSAGGGSPRGWLVGLAGALAAVIVILIIVLVVVATAPPSASKILQNANNADLKDATYSITAPLTVNFSASGTSAPTTLTLTGTGKLTTAKASTTPSANDIAVSVPFIGSQNAIEVITTNKNLYVNLGSLASLLGGSAPSGSQWLSLPIGDTSINLLSYSNMTNTKYIGSETINGHSTWHIRGTLSEASATPTASSTTSTTPAATATEDLWIRQDNSFPAKVQITFNASTAGLNLPTTTGTSTGGTTAIPSGVSGTLTLLFTAWNSNLSITAPANSTGFTGLGSGDIFPFPLPTTTP